MLSFEKTNADAHDYIVTNSYEGLVKENVLKTAQTMDMCTCGKCMSDVCALVLNQITPHYVTTRKGELLSQLESLQGKNIDLTVKVVHALHLVKDSPRH